MGRIRRGLFGAGAGLVLVAGARRVEAVDPAAVEVEATAYGGASSGRYPPAGCASGPASLVHYAGLGARVRVRPAPRGEHRDEGFAVGAAAAVEYHGSSLVAPSDDGEALLPASRWLPAGSVRVGYDWRWLGLHGGALALPWYGAEPQSARCMNGSAATPCAVVGDYGSPHVQVLPDVVVRVGPRDTLHAEAGFGAYDVVTLHRPGLYGGVAYGTPSGWEVALHGGYHAVFNDRGGFRADLGVRIPMNDSLRLGAGLALSEGLPGRVEPEGRGSVEVRF